MLYKKLRQLRETNKLKQSDIAKKLNITREAYSMYENNKRQMNYESLCIISDIFNVSADYLLGRESSNFFSITDEERIIIEKFRKIDERGREGIKSFIDIEYNRLFTKKDIKKEVV